MKKTGSGRYCLLPILINTTQGYDRNMDILNSKKMQLTARNIASDILLGDFPMNFFWMDKNGICLGCNQALLDRVGLKSDKDFIGKHAIDFSTKAVWENTQRCMAQNKRFVAEESHTTDEGEVLYYFSVKEPICDDKGTVQGLLGLSIDITEIKARELALAKAKQEVEVANEAKSVFLGNMNHEIRTPLSCIASVGELLRMSESLAPDLVEYVEILNVQAKALLQLTEKLFEYQRLEKAPVDVQPELIDMYQLVHKAVDSIRERAKEKGVSVHVNAIDIGAKKCVSDENIVLKVLSHLLDNAEKFTHQGQITVELQYHAAKLCQHAQWEVTIKDTGVGIPEEKITHIFEPFVRLSFVDSSLHKGMGLGLTEVRTYLRSLGGDIEVDSVEGKGSTFRVLLPQLEEAVA